MPEAWRDSEPGVRLDAKLAALARSQEAVCSLAQCASLGLGARAVQKRAGSGRLHRIHRGVYSLVPHELLTQDGLLMAAVLAAGPGAVLSHESAAARHGLIRPTSEIHVTAPARHTLRGVTVHRSTTLTARDTTRARGIPCTTVPRTLLDLGDDLNAAQHDRALNRAEAQGRLNLPALDDQLARNGARSAAHRLRARLAAYRPGQAPTESPLEDDFLALIRAHHLPEPDRQVVLDLEDRGPPIRVDFMWREAKVVIETDGIEHHGTRRAFRDDRRRDQRLARARWRHARVTWEQVHDDPASVVALVVDLLAA
jgi:very-short-patch-repair endonuclease/predicted transcriptional regulator of viral defense system